MGLAFLEVKKQLFTTFGFSAAGPAKSQHFCGPFFGKKNFRRAANTIHRQLLIEN
jgi:hypothetical protein